MSRTSEFGAVSRGQTFTYEPESLVLITDKSHPLYDERVNMPLDEGMVLSIMAHGVIDPIVVRKNGTDKDGNPIIEVIDGRQRVKCTIEANGRLAEVGQPLLRIKAIMRISDEQDAIACMVITNEIRRQDDLVTRAQKLVRLLARGYSENEAQIAFGLSHKALRDLQAVAGLDLQVQAQIKGGKISLSCALELARLPQQEQQRVLEETIGSAESTSQGEVASDDPTDPEEQKITVAESKSKKLTAAAVKRASGRAKTTKATKRSRPAKILIGAIKDVQRGKIRGPATFKDGVMAALKWAIGDDRALDFVE